MKRRCAIVARQTGWLEAASLLRYVALGKACVKRDPPPRVRNFSVHSLALRDSALPWALGACDALLLANASLQMTAFEEQLPFSGASTRAWCSWKTLYNLLNAMSIGPS